MALKKIRLDGEDEGIPSTRWEIFRKISGIFFEIFFQIFSVREITLLKELKHPNIVELISICLENEKIYLVFEYMNMDLKQYLDSTKR